ncbi:hypothetical protein P3L10_029885 [Capsicum annuum]
MILNRMDIKELIDSEYSLDNMKDPKKELQITNSVKSRKRRHLIIHDEELSVEEISLSSREIIVALDL